jgi:hypothetical protein
LVYQRIFNRQMERDGKRIVAAVARTKQVEKPPPTNAPDNAGAVVVM